MLRFSRHLPRGGGVVALAGLLILAIGVAPASAQPAPPPAPPATAADAAAQLATVQHDAEILTEQWHAAQDDLVARRAAVDPLRAAVGPAQAAVDTARAEEEGFRRQIDLVALAAFESGNLDQFNALLGSSSPQNFLDQMSTLETVTADHRATLDQLQTVVDRTARAQAEADAAVARALTATDEAVKAEKDIGVRKRAADVLIENAEKLLRQLSPQQRSERIGPLESGPAEPIVGNGVGVKALRAAMAQLGKPYRWGAEGPGSFDCSGLTSWAFKQAGVTLPRSSSSQAVVGQPVSWDSLRPGDLVFYYSPVSHVGIYVGNGKMINAPQTGDVVKYATVSSQRFSGARRL